MADFKKFGMIAIIAVSLFVCNKAQGQEIKLYGVTKVTVEAFDGSSRCYAYAGEEVRDEIHPLIYNLIKTNPTNYQFVVVTAKDGTTVNSIIEKGALKDGVFEVERVAIDPEDESISMVYFVGKDEPLRDHNDDLLTLNPGQKIMMVEFLGLNHNYHGYLTVPRETEVRPFGPVAE